jgi:hypothetical protein
VWGSALPWCADYAATRAEVPEENWVTLGFTYDSRHIRAYINGTLDTRALDPVRDRRTDPYFTKEGPGGKDRGMNPYYHGRGTFRYDPARHAPTKPGGGSDFTVGARYAVGSMLGEATKGRFGALAVRIGRTRGTILRVRFQEPYRAQTVLQVCDYSVNFPDHRTSRSASPREMLIRGL